jgi:ribokinase
MIIVFGSLNIDMVMPVDHFPAPGETVLCAADYLSRTGGKGANQAVAAVRMGAKVAMVGKVGDDAFGRRSVNNLKTQSVLTAGMGISERPTGCSTIAVDDAGKNMVFTAPGANLDVTSDQIPDDILNPKNLVLAQLETPPAVTLDVLARAKVGGAPTILNASPAQALTPPALKLVDYLIVNEVESQQLAKGLGIKDTDTRLVAAQIAAMGAPDGPGLACIITMEGKGSIAARGRSLWHQEALPVDVVDSTGAGDAFCGIFAACLQAGRPWIEALRFASTGASLSCLGLGAQAGMPFAEDIEAAIHGVGEARKLV